MVKPGSVAGEQERRCHTNGSKNNNRDPCCDVYSGIRRMVVDAEQAKVSVG